MALKSAEKQKYKMRKTTNPLSHKAFRAVSFSATKGTKGHPFGCPFCFPAESGIGNRTYEKQDIREDVLFLQSNPQ